MNVTVTQVRQLANAYRETMDAGAEKFRADSVDARVLLAMLAASASATLSWIKLRVPDGDVVSAPLTDLAEELQKGDKLGTTLQAVETAAFQKARGAIISMTLTGTGLLWLSSVLGIALGVFVRVQNAGVHIGAVVIPALLGGGSALGAVIKTLRPSSTLISRGATSLLQGAQTLGSGAETLFREKVGPVFDSIFEGRSRPPVPVLFVRNLRNLATGIVWSSYILLGIVLVFFAVGILDAWTAYIHSPDCHYFCSQ
jgi:hypothetical protein